MPYRICLPLHRKTTDKDRIFIDKMFCFDLYQEKPRFIPKGDPGPFVHLQSLATIVDLAASLPEKLPMRSELQNLASRALEAAAADLGDDVKLEHYELSSQAK